MVGQSTEKLLFCSVCSQSNKVRKIYRRFFAICFGARKNDCMFAFTIPWGVTSLQIRRKNYRIQQPIHEAVKYLEKKTLSLLVTKRFGGINPII